MTNATIHLSHDELLLTRAAKIEAEQNRRDHCREILYNLKRSLSAAELGRVNVEASLRAMKRVELEEQERGSDASSWYPVYKSEAVDEILVERYLRREVAVKIEPKEHLKH